jgi:hypothetical protein
VTDPNARSAQKPIVESTHEAIARSIAPLRRQPICLGTDTNARRPDVGVKVKLKSTTKGASYEPHALGTF